ncbi:MAG: hypothetical protein ACREIC_34190 [Limisphaerales bacterium]
MKHPALIMALADTKLLADRFRQFVAQFVFSRLSIGPETPGLKELSTGSRRFPFGQSGTSAAL